jgi:hypothetical protein
LPTVTLLWLVIALVSSPLMLGPVVMVVALGMTALAAGWPGRLAG